MLRRIRQLSLLAVPLLLLACDGDDPHETDPSDCDAVAWSGDASLEVGTGEDCFAPLVEGATVPLIGGPQGGFHLWLGLRCRDCATHETIHYAVRDPQTDEPVYGTIQSAHDELHEADGYRFVAGLTALVPGVPWVDQPGMGEDFVGQDLIFYADANGHASEVQVRVGPVEWQPSECPDCN